MAVTYSVRTTSVDSVYTSSSADRLHYSFILAAMGGAVGLGNLLRYPAVVYANNGLQWFIP
jgi:SNF family Na+-dependent transporter